jgi:hypothetical protein
MRKIDSLIESQKAGKELDDQQQALVSSLDEIVEKVEEFMSAELDKEEEGSEEEEEDDEDEEEESE